MLIFTSTNKQTTTKMDSQTYIKYGKIVTIIKGNNVRSISKKSDFWIYVDSLTNFVIVSSCNNKQIIKKLTDKGFNLDIDSNYGFDFDIKITAKK